MKVYLDSNIFIYAAINSEKMGDNARQILQFMEEGRFSGATSFTAFEELLFVIFKERGKETAVEAGKAFLLLNNLELINFSKESMLCALDGISNYKLRPRDAMHLAAIKSKSIPYILSEDSDFDSIQGIKRYGLAGLLKKMS